MTSPDGAKPTKAVTYAQISAMQNYDPAIAAGIGNGDVTGLANAARGNLLTNILGGFIGGIAQLISTLFSGIFGGGGGGILDLIGGLLGVRNSVDNVVNVEVPRLDNRIDEVTVGGVTAKRSFFGNDGTWVRPEGGPWSRHVVEVIAGSGGGGRSNLQAADGTNYGGGGYAGGWNAAEFFDSDLPASVAVHIGPGGAGATTANSHGGPGGQTDFGNIISAGGATINAHGFGAKTLPLRGGNGGYTFGNGFEVAATAGTGHSYANGGIAGTPNGSGTRGGDGSPPSPVTMAHPGSAGGGGARRSAAGGNGGNGGNGGYPGAPGGGGGKGGGFGGSDGNGGNGAAGACWVTSYK